MAKYIKVNLSSDGLSVCPVCSDENNHRVGNICSHVYKVTARHVAFYFAAPVIAELEELEEANDDDNETFQDIYCDDDLKIDHIPDVAECRKLRAQFAKQNFWPNVFVVNDHGNVDLLRIGYNGAKIVKSWV